MLTRLLAAGSLAVTAALVPAQPAAAAPCVVAAAGDIAAASDYRTGAARTAAQIKATAPAKVIALGDLAYESGTASEFATYYRPTWGAFESITEAVAGNHEYRTPGADGMEAELGEASNDNRGFTICGWRVVLLNSYKGVQKAASFLQAQRAAYPRLHFLVAWHEPRRSSGRHGNEPAMQTLWAYARGAGAKVVLNAHDHDYERFAKLDINGVPASNGTRQFVSGLGGHAARPFSTIRAYSQKRFTGQPAVLYLTLNSSGTYSWRLRSVDGVLRDSGSSS